MENRDIPALVKRLRSAMGLTQEKFAQEVGVSFSTVNQWENGRRRPHPFLLKKLEELEVTMGHTIQRQSKGTTHTQNS